MPAFTIKAPAYAASIGLAPRSILRFINVEKMPGARKVKRTWRIDAAQAEPWIREHHPRIFQGEAEPHPRQPNEPQSEDQPETEAEITDRHIQRLNHILDGMVTVLHDGTEADTERSVGNTWVWKGVHSHSPHSPKNVSKSTDGRVQEVVALWEARCLAHRRVPCGQPCGQPGEDLVGGGHWTGRLRFWGCSL